MPKKNKTYEEESEYEDEFLEEQVYDYGEDEYIEEEREEKDDDL